MKHSFSCLSSLFAILFLVCVFACSSSSSNASSNDCSCDISVNGQKKTVTCGSDTCLAGTKYTCSSTAQLGKGGTCTETSGNDASTPNTATSIECYGTSVVCDPKTEYCIRSFVNGVKNAGICVPLNGCNGCDCLQNRVEADWKEHEGESNNCSQAVSCVADDGAFTVVCHI